MLRRWLKSGLFLGVSLALGIFFSAPWSKRRAAARMLRDDPTDDGVIASIRSVPSHYAFAYQEMYLVPSTGNNLYGGSDASTPSMTDTAGTGGWVSATGVYTSVATNGTVTVGQYISIYTGTPTETAFVGRITAVSGGGGSVWVITVSVTGNGGTAFAGVIPTTGSAFKAYVGGGWQGPHAAVTFPFSMTTLGALVDGSGNYPRFNWNHTTSPDSSITAAIASASAGPYVIQGYTTTAGDGGRFVLDGGTSGTSYVLLTCSGQETILRDAILQNNGATSNAAGLSVTGNDCLVERVTVHAVRGSGISLVASGNTAIECEAYTCNQNNSVALGGIISSSRCFFKRCIVHHNSGSNNDGFVLTGASVLEDCVADTCGRHGILINGANLGYLVSNCVLVTNTGSGVHFNVNGALVTVDSCIFESNAVDGINVAGTGNYCRALNNAYHGNGATVAGQVDETGAVTCASNPIPNASKGDYTPTSGVGLARNAGRGAFTQNLASWTSGTGCTSYPDCGAVQHQDTGSTTVVSGLISG